MYVFREREDVLGYKPARFLCLAAVFTATLSAVAWADHVSPVIYGDEDGEENNPSCAFLNSSWSELKINQAPNGTYQDGSFAFTIKGSDGKTFDWESSDGIDALVVKGGNRGSNVYFYDPEETADKDVRSPANTQGNVPAVSHVSVCYDADGDQAPPGGDGEPQDEPPQDEPPQEEPPQEEPQEEPQDEPRDGDGQNQRPSEPDEPQSEGNEAPREDGGRPNERQADPDEPEDEGDAEQPEGDEQPEGEGEVEGVLETDDGEADEDVAEETESDSAEEDTGDELPFTGAPLGGLLLIALALLMTGMAGRTATRR